MATSDSTSDPWGEQTTLVSAHNDASSNTRNPLQTKLKSVRIPDDWDDDEEEEKDSREIWETANTKSPMPQVVVSRSSTSATVISPPPPTIIQAPLRILKRQTPTTTPATTSSASPSPVPQTLAEREAKYREARDRIFGGPSGLSGQDGLEAQNPLPESIPNVIRDPTGPETATPCPNPNMPRGFSGKRGRRPPKP